MSRKKSFLFAAALAGLILLAGTASFAQQLSDIQAAIKAKGQKWIAEDTSVSVLPDNEKKLRLGLMKHALTGKEQVLSVQTPLTGLAPSVDWSSFVTAVRNQGSCGSCWAFAATAALESNILIRENRPATPDDRAEQILVSCSGAGSCSGGYISSASDYIRSTGLPAESFFPYTATNNSCSSAQVGWQSYTSKVGAWSYVNTAPANLTAIKNALATYGPLITTMDVYYDFFSYGGGIYEYASGAYQGGHAILIVGYTDDTSRPDGGYFKVKNSWGTGWGSGGYFLIGYSQLGNPVYFGEFTIAFSNPVLPAPPAAPGNLAATAASSSQVNLSWTDNSGNEDGFKIERCSGSGCTNFAQIVTVGANVTSYSNANLAGSTSYSYRVRAYNAGGDSGYSNTASATTPAPQPPTAPSGLAAAPASSSQISLTWSDNSTTEAGFKIERCSGPGCTNFAQIATVGVNVKSYNDTGLTANTSYSYRVCAYVTGADSGWAGPAAATTPCTCTISPANKNFSASGGTQTIAVTTPADCPWTVQNVPAWITLDTPASGRGNGSFAYSVSKNTGTRRTAALSVSGKVHSVTQSQGKK